MCQMRRYGHNENSVQSHKRFQEKAGLQFPLLSDPKKEVARSFHNLKVQGQGKNMDSDGDLVTAMARVSHYACRSATPRLTCKLNPSLAHAHMQGRNVARTTVMIDPEGKVMKVWADIPENKVEANPFEALECAKQMLEA